MEYIFKSNELCKYYRNFKAIDKLNMNIPKGSIYGLVGRNGAGKTTLIRLICGLQNPTSGDFVLYGKSSSANDISKSRRRMGAVIETPSIYMNMTAEDNIRMQYRNLGMPDFSHIPELLKLVGLDSTEKKKAKHFSLGMRQRLGIAIAIAGNPDFLILDEPTNGLDPQGIIEIRELIIKLNREKNITVLISSHILGELSKLATHYGFIDHGSMIKEISEDELEKSYRKCIRVTFTNTNGLIKALDSMKLEYKLIDENTADIYGQPGTTRLINCLSAENCEISSITEHDEGLESYFIKLVGGDDHESAIES